ncbi:MAG: thioredoxin domain-containing protein [Elusimicrobiota bacterium]
MTTRNAVFLMAVVAILSGWTAPPEKKDLIDHLRAAYDFPSVADVDISEPASCDVPGFRMAKLSLRYGTMEHSESLYISEDGRYYMLGKFKDVRVHPYEERLKKMELKDAGVRGKADAPVTVAQFTDFQCPYCQRGFEIMRDRVLKDFPDKVRWVYKSFPLAEIHPWAQPAAVAVECARKQGNEKFWSLHDALFDAQREIRADKFEEKLQELAKKAGIDDKKLMACYDKEESLPTVRRDVKEAAEVGVNSTPSFVVNGRIVAGADYNTLKRVIEDFLGKKVEEKR